MNISPDQVNQFRGIVTWVLRAVAIVLLATGAYFIIKRLSFAAGVGNFSYPFTIYEDVGEGASIYRGIGMVIVGTLLGILSGQISRWIITMPPKGCPRCGQPKPPGGGPHCTECGLEWSD